jgi:ABC-type siderophore export system fused ATPase/permease subunit
VVVVISHDDRFFNLADTLIIMEEGKLLRTERLRSELRELLALESDAVV